MAERVLITGARAVAALDIARSLRAAGYEPHLADCSPAWLARASRAAGPVHRHAAPVDRPAAFARDLRGLIDRLDPVGIIPTCEEVFHLAALAEADGFSDRLFAPPPDRLAALHAKNRFAALCGGLGLPVPETTAVADRAGLDAFSGDAADHVFKPVWSRFGARVLVAPGREAFAAIAPSEAAPWVIECNPRATSGVHLFDRSAAFGRALMGGGPAAPVTGIRHLAPALWLQGLPAALRHGRLAAWRRQRRQGLDAVAMPGDRGPVLGALADAAVFGLRALRTGRTLTEAMTADIEWNGPSAAPR